MRQPTQGWEKNKAVCGLVRRRHLHHAEGIPTARRPGGSPCTIDIEIQIAAAG
jgi:hypothetical protein